MKTTSIKTVFNKHLGELYALMESPTQFGKLKEKVNSLLDSPELKNNTSVAEARLWFNNCHNYNHYLSTLMSYITGMAVGK